MNTYKVYNGILSGDYATEYDALEYARGVVWNEIETRQQSIVYANYIDTIDGVGVYYDFGADYYFFTDETEEE
jgi:hypothetical protein